MKMPSQPDCNRPQLAEKNWRVRVIDTGLNTMTGGRIARAFDEASKDETFEQFGVTYGDGLCDVDLDKEFQYHLNHNEIGTVLSVPPTARFGELDIDADQNVTRV